MYDTTRFSAFDQFNIKFYMYSYKYEKIAYNIMQKKKSHICLAANL